MVRGIIPEFGRGSAVAALVLIGELVEMRHFGSGTSARDHFDQLFAVENGLVEVGRLSRRARVATTVAIDAVISFTSSMIEVSPLTLNENSGS